MYLLSKINNKYNNITVGIIGCGKFMTMFLSQLKYLKKIKLDCIVDVNIKKAQNNCKKAGLNKDFLNNILFFENVEDLINRNLDIVIEATGNAIIGVTHAIKVIKSKKNIIMVNVEADVLCGKYLSDLASRYSVKYSLAYGDQPSLIIEQIEWAETNGFDVVCAGKGTKYHPIFEYSTPNNVWKNYGIDEKVAIRAGMNAKMFNSFITGDKSSIEMAAVVNASKMICPENGLSYYPMEINQLANKLIPKIDNGYLQRPNQVEVISSINKKKSELKNNLRFGTFIVFKARNKYAQNCFKEYGMITDKSGKYSAIWRPYHYVGLELATTIYSIALDKKTTGDSKFFKADVVAIAKKNLQLGEQLDGEGGFCARGRLTSAEGSKNLNLLPIGLSDKAIANKFIKKDEFIKFSDVDIKWNKDVKKAREYQNNLLK